MNIILTKKDLEKIDHCLNRIISSTFAHCVLLIHRSGQLISHLGNVPGIAGRSPSYTIRQLYDMQHGARAGLGAEQMKAVVAHLSEEDMVAIAAYTASRVP